MKKSFLTLLAFLMVFNLVAQQENSKSLSVYFKTGSPEINNESRNTIDSFFKTLPSPIHSILVQGYTDQQASDSYNKLLSKKRAENVKAFIEKFAKPTVDSPVMFWGEEHPVANNNTPQGRQLNRRTEIRVVFVDTVREITHLPSRTIKELYAALKPPPELHCINNTRDTILTTHGGSIVIIKANSFAAAQQCNCISIKIEEAFTKDAIVRQNLSTSANGRALESQGMIKIEALCGNDSPLTFLPGMEITVMTPADKIAPSAGIFVGDWDSNNDMQWAKDSLNKLGDFAAADAKDCLNGIGFNCGFRSSRTCATCKFFFCGLKNGIKGIGNKAQRDSNSENRACRKRLAEIAKEKKNKAKAAMAVYNQLSSAMSARVDSLAAKWQVKKEEVALAMDKCGNFFALLAENKITDLQAMADGLAQQIDSLQTTDPSRKNILLSSLQYNVFRINRPNWYNVDWLASFADKELTDFTVLPAPNTQFTDCKLVFKSRATVLEGVEENGKYKFSALPKGETAYLVYSEMKDGVPDTWFGIEEITIAKKEFTVTTKPTPTATIVKMLSALR